MVGGISSFSGDDPYALHHRLVNTATAEAGPVTVVARVGDCAVGLLCGFMFRSVFSYFQSGWDPEFSPLSIGSVLVDESIRRAADAGCDVFDFLRGPEPCKYRFGAEDTVDHSFIAGRTLNAELLRSKYAVRQPQSKRADAANT